MQVEDRSGQASPAELQAATGQLVAAAAKDARLTALFSGFRATVPQLYANLDRTRAKEQNVAVTDVFQTLGVYLGSAYVNDFNYLGRVFRVTAQADARYRAKAADVAQLKTRNRAGQMVPLGAVMDIRDIVGPDRISHYNLYGTAEINGNGAAGVSSGEAIAIMENLARQNLPRGYSFEWTEFAFQENTAGNTALLIFPLCIFFVWMTHSAEYESFSLSTSIILIVPMCLLCGIAGVWATGQDNNIFTQIGFVVLAGLSAKNAVLIVEFAKQQQERGKDAATAATEAAQLRLRPILMTSFAFILGVVPLVTATGAGSEMRHALGTVVFYGMLGVTVFGLFLTPVFFYVIRRLSGKNIIAEHAPEATPGEGAH
jgi:multidrug efflux pump subunit AcrB